MKTIEQAYRERELLKEGMKGATESSRSALSAIFTRNVLKFKEETEKIKRDQENAAAQIAAEQAKADASGAVTLEQRKLAVAARQEQIRKNEALSMIGLGIYDPSYTNVLGMSDEVIRSAAQQKDREYRAAKAVVDARNEYQQTIAEIQKLREERERYVRTPGAYEQKMQNAIEAYESENGVVEDAGAAKEQILKESGAGTVANIPYSKEKAMALNDPLKYLLNGQNPALTVAPDKGLAKREKTVQRVQQEAAKVKEQEYSAAAAYYDELLTKRIKEKEAEGKALSALEESFKKTYAKDPSAMIAAAQLERNGTATPEEYASAYENYINQIDGAVGHTLIVADLAINQAVERQNKGEQLTGQELKNVMVQITATEKLIAALHRELREEDFSIEEQDAIEEQIRLAEQAVTGLKAAREYSETYGEYKDYYAYKQMDDMYGAMSDDEVEMEIQRLEESKTALPPIKQKDPDSVKAYNNAFKHNQPIEDQIKKVRAYLEKRQENKQLEEQRIAAGNIASAYAGKTEEQRMSAAINDIGARLNDIQEYEKYLGQGVAAIRNYVGSPYHPNIIEVKDEKGDVLGWGYKSQQGEIWMYYYSAAGNPGEELDLEESVVSDRSVYKEKWYTDLQAEKKGILEKMKTLTSVYHSNLLTYAESAIAPEELEAMANQYIRNFDQTEFNNLGGEYKHYNQGNEDIFKGWYNSFYRDIPEFVEGNYGDFTRDEALRILALLGSENSELAFNYYATIKENVHKRQAEDLNGVLRTAAGITSGVANFAVNGMVMISNAVDQSYARVGGNIMTASHQVTMEKIGELGFGSEALETLYMGGYAIIDMLPAVALGFVPGVGTAASTGYLYTKAFAQGYNQSILKGKRADEAVTFAGLSAASEVVMEKLLGGVPKVASKAGLSFKISAALENLASTKAMQKAFKLASSMGSEGFEEFLQEAVSPFLAKVSADLNGIEDAELEKIDWEEAAKSFVIGALVGGAFTGLNLASENSIDATSYEMLANGDAVDLINIGARLGNKRAIKIKAAQKNGTARYQGKTGLFSYASVADISNIQKSVKRRCNRQATNKIFGRIETNLKQKKPAYRLQAKEIFQKVLYGKSLNLHEAAMIVNDSELLSIFEEMLGMEVSHLLPNEVAALAKLSSFVDENGKVPKARLELFKDAFGELNTKALQEIAKYSDLAGDKLSGILYEDAEVKNNLTEAETEATEAMKIVSNMTGILLYVTDSHATGDFLAPNIMAVNRKDMNQGAFYLIGYKSHFMMKEQDQELGAEIKRFLSAEAKRILGEEGYAEAIKKIRQQKALNGSDINDTVAEDVLCAQMMPSILLRGAYAGVDQLAEQNIEAAELLRKTLGALESHLEEEMLQYTDPENYVNIVNQIERDENFRIDEEFVKISGSTPKKLIEILGVPNVGLIVKFNKLYGMIRKNGNYEKTKDYHNLGGDFAKNIYKLLEKPKRIVLKADGRFNIICEYHHKKNDAVLISIEIGINKKIKNKFDDYNIIVTAFDTNDNYQRNNENKEGSVVVYDEKNSTPQVKRRAAYVPPVVNGVLFNNSIPNSSENVNGDFYQTLFDGISKDISNIYDRLTDRIKEYRFKKFGYRNGDVKNGNLRVADPLFDEIISNLRINDGSEIIGTVKNFVGTPAMQKIGIKIAGSVGDYSGDLRGQAQIAKKYIAWKRKVRDYIKRNRINDLERSFAKDYSNNKILLEEIPDENGVRLKKVIKLAGIYSERMRIERSGIKKRGLGINNSLTNLARADASKLVRKSGVKGVLQDLIQKPWLTAFETPRRVFQEFFGFENGAEVFARWYQPVEENNRLKNLFIDKRTETVRQSMAGKWTPEERKVGAMLIEAQLYDDAVSDPISGNAYRMAVNDIYNQVLTPGQAMREYGIRDFKRLIQCVNSFDVKVKAMDIITNNEIDTKKLQPTIKSVREEYSLLYDAINDFLVAHGMEPISFIRYYTPHMQLDSTLEKFRDVIRRIGTQESISSVPVELVGNTHTYQPNKKWNPHLKERKGTETDYDLLVSYQVYLNYFSNVIYHTDDIMRLRALERAVRLEFSKEDIKGRYDEAIKASEMGTIDEQNAFLREVGEIEAGTTLSNEDAAQKLNEYLEKLTDEASSDLHAGRFATWLQDMANIRAGKQSSFDRGWEAFLERDGLEASMKLFGKVKAGKVAGSISSMMKQTLQVVNGVSKGGMKYTAKALWDIAINWKECTSFADEIPLLVGKRDFNPLVEGFLSKAGTAIGKPMQVMDYLTSLTVAKAGYFKGLSMGMDDQTAKLYANEFATKIMGSRQNGEKPRGFYAKGPILQSLAVFAVEAHNSIQNLTFDTVAEYSQIKRTKGKKAAMKYVMRGMMLYFVLAFFGNRMEDEIMNQTPIPFDIIGILTQGIAAGQEKTAREFWMQTIDNVSEDLGGERIFATERHNLDFDVKKMFGMIGEELLDDFIIPSNFLATLGLNGTSIMKDIPGSINDIINDTIALSKEPTWEEAAELLVDIFGVLPIPLANQLRKTVQGVWTVVDGGNYKMNSNGERQLLYPVDGFGEGVKSVLFGKYASYAAQKYYDTGEKPLTVKQTQIYDMLVEDGVDAQHAYEILLELRDIKKETESGSMTEDRDAQRKYILEQKMSNDQRYILYQYTLSDIAKKEMSELVLSGVPTMDAMESYAEYRSIDVDPEFEGKEKDKATEFSYYLDQVVSDPEDRKKIKSLKTFQFGVLTAVTATEYEAMTDAGVSLDDAYDTYFAVAELTPKEGEKTVATIDRYLIIDQTDLSEESKKAALVVYGSDSDKRRMTIAFEDDVTSAQFVKVKQNIEIANEAAGKTSASNARIQAAIDMTDGLTARQKAILWQIFSSSDSAKNNPYSSTVGWEALAKVDLYKAAEE